MDKRKLIDAEAVHEKIRVWALENETDKNINLSNVLDVLQIIRDMPEVETPDVVRCAECASCYRLTPVDPMIPHDGTGDPSFYCERFQMDFYAPRYNANTYFCAEGVRRKAAK
jgi:hypothetical protein